MTPLNSSALLSSLMASVDDVKEKLSEGEYLKMSNLLKSLYDSINNKDDYEDLGENAEQDSYGSNLTIREELKNLFDDNYLYDEDNNFIRSYAECFEYYNNHLKIIQNRFINAPSHIIRPSFVCRCGSCLNVNQINQHIETEEHKNNFNNDFQ